MNTVEPLYRVLLKKPDSQQQPALIEPNDLAKYNITSEKGQILYKWRRFTVLIIFISTSKDGLDMKQSRLYNLLRTLCTVF